MEGRDSFELGMATRAVAEPSEAVAHLETELWRHRRDCQQIALEFERTVEVDRCHRLGEGCQRRCGDIRRTAAGDEHASGKSRDRKSTRLNSSHMSISYAVFCLKKKK